MRILLRPLSSRNIILLGGVFAIATGVLFGANSYAQLTEDRVNTIKQNCVSAQVEIQRVRYNDTATRVNRGQGYETLLSTMINPLNSRATANGYNDRAAVLTTVATKYQKSLAKFKKDYDTYDDTLASILRLKCADKPEFFYENLEKARQQRTGLAGDVANLSQLIVEYQAAATKLQEDLR